MKLRNNQENCKERTTCTNSSEVKPDLCEDQDQQCSIKCKSKCKADRTAKVNFNALKFTLAVRSALHLDLHLKEQYMSSQVLVKSSIVLMALALVCFVFHCQLIRNSCTHICMSSCLTGI